MIVNVYSIFDSKSRVFSRPYYCINGDVALRGFAQLANDKQTEIGAHPADFTLFCIGTFDDELGALYSLAQHENLGLAATFVHQIRE